MEAPSQIESFGGLSDGQTRLWNIYCWSANSQASRTVLLLRRKLARTQEEIREADIIYQRGPKHAGQTKQALVCPGQLAAPGRRIGIRLVGRGSERAAAVMRVANERRVPARE